LWPFPLRRLSFPLTNGVPPALGGTADRMQLSVRDSASFRLR
jgi:hypothetical protein